MNKIPSVAFKLRSNIPASLIKIFRQAWSFNGRRQRAETKPAVTGCIDDFVEAYGIYKPFFHKQGGIKKEVVSHNNIKFRDTALHPLDKLPAI